MRRSAAARAHWKNLPASFRALLLSHRLTDFEQEERLRHSVMTALTNVFGPRTFGADAARQEEPDVEYEPVESLYARTLPEIAEELHLSVERVRQIEMHALRNAKAAFEKMEKDRERAIVLAGHAGLTFAEAMLLVEANADGRVWAAIDEPRRTAQEKRSEEQAKRDRETAEREREQREQKRRDNILAMEKKQEQVRSSLASRPYVPYALRLGPHGFGCQCPWPSTRR